MSGYPPPSFPGCRALAADRGRRARSTCAPPVIWPRGPPSPPGGDDTSLRRQPPRTAVAPALAPLSLLMALLLLLACPVTGFLDDAGGAEENALDETTSEAPQDDPAGKADAFHVASLDFHRVQTPFIIAIWVFSATLAKIGFHMTGRLSKIFPESCLLIVVGVVVGLLLFYTSEGVGPLTPETFFIYMLPPIILDAGYFMPNRMFFDHLGTILLMAVVGTIWNTFTIGTSLYLIGLTGMYGQKLSLLPTFLFGALISAVDPVAVLAMFEEIQVNEVLYIVVFGESLLNDAVTVVLYHMFEVYSAMGEENIRYSDILAGVSSFVVIGLGGTLVGVAWGYLVALVTRFTHHVPVIEPVFIFVMAYLSYLNAEMFHLSGILAITFCGITMKNYIQSNVSEKALTTIKYAIKMMSQSSETIIFVFLGVSTVNDHHVWNTWFIVFTIVFCTFYRALGVVILTGFANHFRIHKIDQVEKFVMAYGGLRGAIAFALVLLIDEKVIPEKEMFATATISVVFFTVFVQFFDHMMAAMESLLGHTGNFYLRDKYKYYDRRYIRRILLREHCIQDPKIIETFSKLQMEDALKYVESNKRLDSTMDLRSLETLKRSLYELSSSDALYDAGLNWNLDLAELAYSPSKKDFTDAKINHLLDTEMFKPTNSRRTEDGTAGHSRRPQYSIFKRHTVDDKDLNLAENERMKQHYLRAIISQRHYHRKKNTSKAFAPMKNGRTSSGDKKVQFTPTAKSGSDIQFKNDHIIDMDSEAAECQGTSEDEGISFTAKAGPRGYDNQVFDMSSEADASGDQGKSEAEVQRVLPWHRDSGDPSESIVRQREFPLWVKSDEYDAFYSPTTTMLKRLDEERHRPSVINLFKHSGKGMRKGSLPAIEISGVPRPRTRCSSLDPSCKWVFDPSASDGEDSVFACSETNLAESPLECATIQEEDEPSGDQPKIHSGRFKVTSISDSGSGGPEGGK